jgi:hypothetical protein
MNGSFRRIARVIATVIRTIFVFVALGNSVSLVLGVIWIMTVNEDRDEGLGICMIGFACSFVFTPILLFTIDRFKRKSVSQPK